MAAGRDAPKKGTEPRRPRRPRRKRPTAQRSPTVQPLLKRDGMIWHVIGWETAYEPDEALRRGQKSPLRYTKDHLEMLEMGMDRQQVALRRRLLVGRPGGLEAWGIFRLIVVAAADRGEHRGYLWNDDGQPATIKEIATTIGATPSQVRKGLAVLKGRYLEFVRKPIERFMAPPRPPREERNDGAVIPPATASAGPVEGKGVQTIPVLSAPVGACRPAPTEEVRLGHLLSAPVGAGGGNMNMNGNRNRNASTATGNGKAEQEKEEAALASVVSAVGEGAEGGTGTGMRAESAGTGTGTLIAPTGAPTADVMPNAEQPRPTVPTEADPAEAAPARVSIPGTALASDAQAMAGRLFVALYPSEGAILAGAMRGGTNGTPVSREEFFAREMGELTALWSGVLKSRVDPILVSCRAIKEAERLAKRRRPARKTNGALWSHVLNGYMAKHIGRQQWIACKRGVVACGYGMTTGPPTPPA